MNIIKNQKLNCSGKNDLMIVLLHIYLFIDTNLYIHRLCWNKMCLTLPFKVLSDNKLIKKIVNRIC